MWSVAWHCNILLTFYISLRDSLQVLPTLPCWPSARLPELSGTIAEWCSIGCTPALSGVPCPHPFCVGSQYYCNITNIALLGVTICIAKLPSSQPLFQEVLKIQDPRFLTICNMGCQVGAQLRNECGMCSSLMLLNVFVLEWVFLSLSMDYLGNPPSNPIAPPVPTSFSPVHFDFTSAQPNTSHCEANSTSRNTFVVRMSNGTVDATSWLVSCNYQGPWAPLYTYIVCVAAINSDSKICMYVCMYVCM